MIINAAIWRNADLVRIVPIQRADLHQAISRNNFRPEETPKPGKARWYSWRDVVAVAAAQELRRIGLGPSIAFGLVQEHLSKFLRIRVVKPGDCTGVFWLIHQGDDHLNIKNTCEFVHHVEHVKTLMAANENACIIVNLGRIATRILNELQATETAQRIRDELQVSETDK